MNIKFEKNCLMGKGDIVIQYNCAKEAAQKALYNSIGSQISISVLDEDHRFKRISICDIQYIENIDGHCFLYTATDSYRSPFTFKQLHKKLKDVNFIQINNITLVNEENIDSVKILPECKRLVTIKSGERLLVSRSFKDSIKHLISK